jgi:uncharacterized phage protein (TIGR01671 family)
MTTIKFRVWDTLDEKMIYFDFSDMLNDITRPPLHSGSCDWYLMRSTGLSDINGKEIYEGDIVKTWAFGTGEVFYWTDYMRFAFRDENDPTNKMKWTVLERSPMIKHYGIEVIGNTYEN